VRPHQSLGHDLISLGFGVGLLLLLLLLLSLGLGWRGGLIAAHDTMPHLMMRWSATRRGRSVGIEERHPGGVIVII
jgi:hypothetical protein